MNEDDTRSPMAQKTKMSKVTLALSGVLVLMIVVLTATLLELRASGKFALKSQMSDASWWRPTAGGCSAITDPFKRAACINGSTPTGNSTPNPQYPDIREMELYGSFTLNKDGSPLVTNILSGTANIVIYSEYDANGSTYHSGGSTTAIPKTTITQWGPTKVNVSSIYNTRLRANVNARILSNSQTYDCNGALTLTATPSTTVLNFQNMALECSIYGSSTGQGTRAVDIQGYTSVRLANDPSGSLPLRNVNGTAVITTKMLNDGRTVQTTSTSDMQLRNTYAGPVFKAIAQASLNNSETSATATVNFTGTSYLNNQVYRCYGTSNFSIPPSVFASSVIVPVSCTSLSQTLEPQRDGYDF